MAEAVANETQDTEARRIREALRGRLTQEATLRLLNDFGDPEQVLDFVLNGDQADVQRYLQQDPSYVQRLHRDAEELAEILLRGPETSNRMFACKDCMRSWWRRVPVRKEVSKCHRCCQKYDCIARDREWGTGVFICECGNEFMGFAVMQNTMRVCHVCRNQLYADHIEPPKKGEKREYRPDPYRFTIIQNNIKYASRTHESAGSTVSTFLTNGSLDTASRAERPQLLDIPEGDEQN